MKRRQFILDASGAMGSLVPMVGWGAVRPCPPTSVGVVGGGQVSTSCSPIDAASDWLSRVSGTGVVWAHDFRSDSEVSQFRWTGNGPPDGWYGNDPSASGTSSANCRRGSDHPTSTGGCLEINIPSGGQCGTNWWRPFSAFGATVNGQTSSDPGANGTLPRRSWNSADQDANAKFFTGYYGHPDYQSMFPTWPHSSVQSVATNYTVAQSSVWDGTDFYLQFRVKITAGRTNTSNPSGKLVMLSTTRKSNPGQEIVLRSTSDMRFQFYTSNGNYENSFLTDPQGAPTNQSAAQPGYHTASCQYNGDRSGCWNFVADEWCTVLLHITPGRAGNPGWADWPVSTDTLVPSLQSQLGGANANTGIEAWVARQGETSYTKIWNKIDYVWLFGSDGNPHPPAFNGVLFNGFMNGDGTAGANSVQGWQQRFAQIIFSKQFIPCPQV